MRIFLFILMLMFAGCNTQTKCEKEFKEWNNALDSNSPCADMFQEKYKECINDK